MTPYFVHGPYLGDYPVFRVVGTETTKPMGSGITLSNVIIDDDWYGTQYDRGQFYGIRGYPATFAATIVDGSGNSIINCTLRNCIRYGLTTFGATNFYIGYNRVEQAQYCISGSGATSIGGVVEDNYLAGMLTEGIKVKNWKNVEVRGNYVDLTPIYSHSGAPSPDGIGFSDDSPNVNENVVIEDNDFVADFFHIPQQVGTEDHIHIVFYFHLTDQLQHTEARCRIESIGGFIEDKEFRTV